jgi:hypothetical protein
MFKIATFTIAAMACLQMPTILATLTDNPNKVEPHNDDQ